MFDLMNNSNIQRYENSFILHLKNKYLLTYMVI